VIILDLVQLVDNLLVNIGKAGIRREGRASPNEAAALPEVYRLGRSWFDNKSIPIVQYEEPTHNYPIGEVGTNNIGSPVVLNTYMQRLRAIMSSEVAQEVTAFDNDMASLITLYFPLILGKIMKDKRTSENLDIRVRFRHKNNGDSFVLGYDEIFNGGLDSRFRRVQDEVETVSGVLSQAEIYQGLGDYIPELEIEGNNNMKVAFIDVQRASTLPSILSYMIARQFGFSLSIVSVDAKRIEGKTGVGNITLLKPLGYERGNSTAFGLNSSFIAPLDFKDDNDAVILFDPMLATGKSLNNVVTEYMKAKPNTKFEDIYIVNVFAGGYEWQSELGELIKKGAHVITLAHDQADLNSKKYIVPGLGDAGDRMVGLNQILNKQGYQRLYNSVVEMRESIKERLYEAFSIHARQVTSKNIRA
jgi:hypothetical protein